MTHRIINTETGELLTTANTRGEAWGLVNGYRKNGVAAQIESQVTYPEAEASQASDLPSIEEEIGE